MKKIVVLGGGISGYGSAILAKKKGFDVFLSDKGRIADRYKAKLDQWQVPYEEGHHSEERILAADEVVKSPGIPDKAPMIVKLREAGIPVISEMEFAGRYLVRPGRSASPARTARRLLRRSSTRSCATPATT